MKHLKLELDNETYQCLKENFKGNEKAMSDFSVRAITNELLKFSNDKNVSDSKKNKADLEDYLKSKNVGSRSYGIKGQGW
jgi:hypothetical protein